MTADDVILFLNRSFANDILSDYSGPNQSPTVDGVIGADDYIVYLGLYFSATTCG